MRKDKTAVPTGMALTHLDPIFRERPNEYLDVMRSREPVHQDRMFDRVVLTRAADVEAVMRAMSLAKLTRSPQGLASVDKESPRRIRRPGAPTSMTLAIRSTL